MVAAAVTLWVMFWLWVAGPRLRLARWTRWLAGGLLLAEFLALLIHHHGTDSCAGEACPPVALAAGVAARVDLPLLSLLFCLLVAAQLHARARREVLVAARRRAARAARPRGRGWPAVPRGSRRS